MSKSILLVGNTDLVDVSSIQLKHSDEFNIIVSGRKQKSVKNTHYTDVLPGSSLYEELFDTNSFDCVVYMSFLRFT